MREITLSQAVNEAIADAGIRTLIHGLMTEEVMPTLPGIITGTLFLNLSIRCSMHQNTTSRICTALVVPILILNMKITRHLPA